MRKNKKIITLLALAILLIAGYLIFTRVTTSVTENLDTYIYALPYKAGTGHKVVQGYGGLFSHRHIAALDFYMPVGTQILAARAGDIYAFKSDSDEGGPLGKYAKKANYIIIKHNDGSFGCYWHLKKDGVVVTAGHVEKGQLIGYSGSTGFVLSPHLHFSVKRMLNYEMNSFVRTKFYTTSGVQLLENNKRYYKPNE